MANNKKQPFRAKPITQRTCVGCRGVKVKGEMIRIVRTPRDAVEVDETGKKSGRGAYLCRRWSCWENGLKKGSLSYTLKTQIAPEDINRLWKYAESLKTSADMVSA